MFLPLHLFLKFHLLMTIALIIFFIIFKITPKMRFFAKKNLVFLFMYKGAPFKKFFLYVKYLFNDNFVCFLKKWKKWGLIKYWKYDIKVVVEWRGFLYFESKEICAPLYINKNTTPFSFWIFNSRDFHSFLFFPWAEIFWKYKIYSNRKIKLLV